MVDSNGHVNSSNIFLFSKTSEQHNEELNLGNLRSFQFKELQVATNNFSSKNLIGKGGFGNVYKGYLQDGTVVAVKRLKDGNAIGGEIQFQTEVEMISLAVHRNLLRLYGFCMTTTERLLVYPYMSNGSVATRLKGNASIKIANSILIYLWFPHRMPRTCESHNIWLTILWSRYENCAFRFSCSQTSPGLGYEEENCLRSS